MVHPAQNPHEQMYLIYKTFLQKFRFKTMKFYKNPQIIMKQNTTFILIVLN